MTELVTKTINEIFSMKLFYKKVSRVKSMRPLSLSAESELSFFASAKRRKGEFLTVKRSKRGKPSPGVSLDFLIDDFFNELSSPKGELFFMHYL